MIGLWICILGLGLLQTKGESILLPLQGGIASLGEYYVNVYIGSPPQHIRLQADTGSSSFVVTSRDCLTCKRKSRIGGAYASNASSSFHTIPCGDKRCGSNTCGRAQCRSTYCFPESNACCSVNDPNTCGFFLQYGGDTDYDVEAHGDMVTDVLQINGQQLSDITIYKTMYESGPWPSQVDGILGLAFPRLNCNPTCSEPSYLGIINSIKDAEKVFSMCMGDSAGYLALGSRGEAENLYHGSPTYVPISSVVQGGTYYSVGLSGIRVGKEILGASLSNAPYHAIVDSGTTLLLLQQSLWRGLVLYFQTRFCRLPGVCSSNMRETIFHPGVCLTQPPLDFPTITLSLVGGVSLDLPPSLYFIHYDTPSLKRKVYCFGIQPAGHDRSVLGDTLLRGFHVIYDYEKHRIGFANPNRTTCGEVELLSSLTDVVNTNQFGLLSGTSKSVRAMAFTFGTIATISTTVGLFLICICLSRALRQPRDISLDGSPVEPLTPPRSRQESSFGTFH